MYAALSALRINMHARTRAVGPGYYIWRLRRSSTTYAISIIGESDMLLPANSLCLLLIDKQIAVLNSQL